MSRQGEPETTVALGLLIVVAAAVTDQEGGRWGAERGPGGRGRGWGSRVGVSGSQLDMQDKLGGEVRAGNISFRKRQCVRDL